MDIDVSDIVRENSERKKDKLNTLVAITIALLATFTGVCKVKDDNIVQAMQQAQADKIDHWSWYQSLHVREEVVSDDLATLKFEQSLADTQRKASYEVVIDATSKKLEHITSRKTELENQAKQDQEKYDAYNFHDDQFDLSDVMMALAISLLAVTSLVQKRWMYFLSIIPASCGVIMGLAGLCGWTIHPDAIIALLS